jgi:predicted RNase H-like HicB family nuclease
MAAGERKMTDVTAIFFDEDGGVTGFVEEFLEVTAHGRDLNEARTRLIEAVRTELEYSHESVRRRAASYGTVTRACLFVEFREP